MDLSRCENEPIHIPGSIQPHGVLLGIGEPDLKVVLFSQNAVDLFPACGDLRGQTIDALLTAESAEDFRRELERDPRDANPMDFRLRDGRAAQGFAHRSDGLLILEIEIAEKNPLRFTADYRRQVRHFERLRHAASVQEVCDIAVREVRALTGYDRVMVYRFDAHANGQVIAEDRADDDLDPYLGLHYPASDIPPQARRLYVQNPIRVIVDADYRPVPLVPDLNPLTGGPLDLSQAALRSISPIHCDYLRNMGVRASMSISLLGGDELWGLIACHHREPLQVPYSVRLVGEFLAHVLSARVSDLERTDALARKSASYSIQSQLIDQMVTAPRFQDGLTGRQRTLADLIDCNGAAILFRGEVTRIGAAPDDGAIRALGAALRELAPGQVVASDCLAELYPPAANYVDRAAGAIAVPISADGFEQIFWFRGEQVRSVTWAGDPAKPAITHANGRRLSPRGSFAAWTEQVRGQSLPWAEWEVEVAADFRTALVASIIHQAAELERLNARLIEGSEQTNRFLATISHELRNPLDAIIGWVRIARMGVGGAKMERALETIERNALAQDQLINDLLDLSRVQSGRLGIETQPLNLAQVVRLALDTVEPSARAKEIRIDSTLDRAQSDIVGDPGRMQQVVGNLLSNAIKFSDRHSRIKVSLARQGTSMELAVRDEGVGISPDLLPHIFDPFRQGEGPERRSGLGLGLSIVRSLVEFHGGTITAHSEGQGRGATFRVLLPRA
jgi:light-regulated signal transduction histidine kinase (bacteriophytochrome)